MQIHSRLALAAAAAMLSPAGLAVAASDAKWTMAPPPPTRDSTSTLLEDVSVRAPDDVWVVGSSWRLGAVNPYAAHWNGTNWASVSPPASAFALDAIDAVAPGDVWAAGEVVLHYDGTDWQVVPSPASTLNKVVDIDLRAPDDGWAVGRSGSAPFIMRRQSGAWTPVPVPAVGAAELTSVVSVSADEAWAAGTLIRPGGANAGLVLHWDGVSWTQSKIPGATGAVSLQSVAAADGLIWAGGSVCRPECRSYVLAGRGGVWGPVPLTGGEVTGMVAFSATDVWAIGYATTPSGVLTDHVEHFDGRKFTVDPSAGRLGPADGNGQPGSAEPLAAAAGDPGSAAIWAVGWTTGPPRLPRAIRRG